MILAPTDIIRVITTSVAPIHVHADYADLSSVSFDANRQNTIISTPTTTTIVGSPGGGIKRQIKIMNITNKSTSVINDLSFEFYDGSTAYSLFERSMNPGDSIQYTVESGWELINANIVPTYISFTGVSAEPAAPPADHLLAYSKKIAGRMVFKAKGPSGIDSPIQNAFWQNNITMWQSTSLTAGLWLGSVGAGAGTFTAALPTNTTLYTSTKRARYANVVTTLNQVLGQRSTDAMFYIGVAPNIGGYFFYARCGFDVWTNGGRFFAGFASATTVISADPSALINTVGFHVDAADNGLIHFGAKDATTGSRTSTGLTLANNKGYDLYIFCAPNGTEIGWRIVEFTGAGDVSGTQTLNLPGGGVALTANVLASNAALTPVTSIQLGVNRIYIETDY